MKTQHAETAGIRAGIALFLYLLCAITRMLPVHAYAEEVGAAPVRVGYYEQEVFQEGAADGTVKTGYAYEYYRKLSEYTGWNYEYVYKEYGELYQMLLNGEIDLLAGLAWKEERAGLIGYPEAVMGSEACICFDYLYLISLAYRPEYLPDLTLVLPVYALSPILRRYHDVILTSPFRVC